MKEFLIYILICHGLATMFYKFKIDDWIKGKSKYLGVFFYELSECRFCMNHHIAVIPAIGFWFLMDADWFILAYPMCYTAFMDIMRNNENN